MTPAMQAARDRVVEAAKERRIQTDFARRQNYSSADHYRAIKEYDAAVSALLALEAQEKEQADAR